MSFLQVITQLPSNDRIHLLTVNMQFYWHVMLISHSDNIDNTHCSRTLFMVIQNDTLHHVNLSCYQLPGTISLTPAEEDPIIVLSVSTV